MKRVSALATTLVVILLLCSVSEAHRGRTDSSGGHYDRSTGAYHYHNGGGRSVAPPPKPKVDVQPNAPEVDIQPNGFYFVKPTSVNGKTGMIEVRLNSDRSETIRPIGIMLLESGKFSDYVVEVLGTKKIWIEFDESIKDENGKLMAYFWLEKPSDKSPEEVRKYLLNSILIREGHAKGKKEKSAKRYAEYLK